MSRYIYHNSMIFRCEAERLSVGELEKDINLTDGEEGVESEVNESSVSAENLAKGFKLFVPGA